MERKPFKVIIGVSPLKVMSGGNIGAYFGSTEDILTCCRRYVELNFQRAYSNNVNVVLAFMLLHKLGEIELSIERCVKGEPDLLFTLDVDGRLILPWPDKFFELGFYLTFYDKERQ